MDIVAYGEYYNKAMQGITDMLLEAGNPLASFKKDRYPEAFQAYLRKHLEVLDAVEQVYQAEEEKNEGEGGKWLEKLADRLVDVAGAELERIPKKGQRNEQLINYNMILAKRNVLKEYCQWLFPILERTEQLCSPGGGKRADRYIGYMGESLCTLYFMVNRDRLMITHAGCRFLT